MNEMEWKAARVAELEAEIERLRATMQEMVERHRAELAEARRTATAERQNAAIEIGGLQGQLKRMREELAESRKLAGRVDHVEWPKEGA